MIMRRDPSSSHDEGPERSSLLQDLSLAAQGARQGIRAAAGMAEQELERVRLRSKVWLSELALRALAGILLVFAACLALALGVYGLVTGLTDGLGLPMWAAALTVSGLMLATGAVSYLRWRSNVRRKQHDAGDHTHHLAELRRARRKITRGLSSPKALLTVGGVGAGAAVALRSRGVRRMVVAGTRLAKYSTLRKILRDTSQASRRAN